MIQLHALQACPLLPPTLKPGLAFLHVTGLEVYKGTSRYNPKQAEATVRLVIKLLQAGTKSDHNAADSSSSGSGSGSIACKPLTHKRLVTARDIGIITPYKAMVHELINKLPQAARAIEVNTVDAFQVGTARDSVLLRDVPGCF